MHIFVPNSTADPPRFPSQCLTIGVRRLTWFAHSSSILSNSVQAASLELHKSVIINIGPSGNSKSFLTKHT